MRVWVPETLQQLCDVRVFVEQAAESITPNHGGGRISGNERKGSQECGLAQRAMGSMGVEVLRVPIWLKTTT
jgi:hypothetical protein